MRNHSPSAIDQFNGLWARGDYDSCPKDHFTDCNNVEYSQTSVAARNRFALFCTGPGIILRSYIYQTVIASVPTTFILALKSDAHLYSIKISPAIAAPVDLITFTADGTAKDFAYENINGRAYISPNNGIVGLNGASIPERDILFVYDGVTIQPAGGFPPIVGGPFAPTNSGTAGSVEAGKHYFAVVGETATGFISSYTIPSFPIPPVSLVATGGFKVDLTGIFTNSGLFLPPLVKRHIIATRVVPVSFVGNPLDLQYFFVPNGTLNDDTTTTLTIDFFDNQLIDDATYLLDLLSSIPSGVMVGTYHNRFILGGTKLAPSTLYISRINDPESIDAVDGVLSVDLPHSTSIVDAAGNSIETGLTNAQEYRDVLYSWKFNRTYAINDNGDVPATWPIIALDEGIGCLVHGVISVLDSSGINIDYLLTVDKTGIYVFDGLYRKPELTWKIADLWKNLNKIYDTGNFLRGVNHYCNDTINKKIYINLSFTSIDDQPTEILLIDYSNVDPSNESFYTQVKFARWRMNGAFQPSSILLYDIGTGVKLLAADITSQNFYEYNGANGTKETTIAPYIQTYLIEDEDEASILHFGALRARFIGAADGSIHVITPSLLGSDLVTSVALPTISIPGIVGYSPTILANFVNQKAAIRLTAANNGYFNLSKLILFMKFIYSSVPM